MITSAFSITFLVNDLADWIVIPNWRCWLLIALIIFIATTFLHILEKNIKIDDLENGQPNLDIKKIGIEPQTPTMFSLLTNELSKPIVDFSSLEPEYYPSTDEPHRFEIFEKTKGMDTKEGEEGERVFALVTNYPKSKEVVGVTAKNVTTNITFLNSKGGILFDTFDKVRWESTPSPSTRDTREQNINSVDINCGETKKLYFMTRKSIDGSLYIHKDESYDAGGWYLDKQKISDKNFFVKIELFAEKINIEPFYYRYQPNNKPEIFTSCSYEDIYDCR